MNIEGRDVLVVEDIIDSLTSLLSHAEPEAREPTSLEICALLTKPERREIDVPVRYVASRFQTDSSSATDDFDEKYRNLPYVAVLDEDLLPNLPKKGN